VARHHLRGVPRPPVGHVLSGCVCTPLRCAGLCPLRTWRARDGVRWCRRGRHGHVGGVGHKRQGVWLRELGGIGLVGCVVDWFPWSVSIMVRVG
jgi:hypothetical protein